MKHRNESKLAAKIDKADRKQKATKEKISKKKQNKRSGRATGGNRPIGDDFSSQNEEAEDELERVSRGPK